MKIHSALEAGGRVVKKETVTSWDRFQAQSIWGIPVNGSMSQTSDPSDPTLNLFVYLWSVNGRNIPNPGGDSPTPSISWDTLSAPQSLPIFPGYGLAKGAVAGHTQLIGRIVQ